MNLYKYSKISKKKTFGIEINRGSLRHFNVIGLYFHIASKSDEAGIYFSITLLGISLQIHYVNNVQIKKGEI